MKSCRVERVKRLMGLSSIEKMLFVEALLLQLSTGFILKIVPFKQIPRLFASQGTLTPDSSPLTLEKIRKATLRAGLASPWRNSCLVQSLAARRMLNRRKIKSQLSLGVTKDMKGRLIAHAWLKAGDFEIVEKSGDYSELYRF